MTYRDAVEAIERRARRLRAATIAGGILLGAGVTAALVGLLFRLLTGPAAARPVFGAVIVVACLALSGLGYAFAVRRSVSLGPLLLRVDFALGLAARLSSLHEVAKTNPGSFVFRRLEREVAPRLSAWRRALPVPARAFGVLALGAVSVTIGALLGAGLPPAPRGAQPALPSSVTATAVAPTDAARSEAAADAPRAAGGLEAGVGPETPAKPSEYRLDDVLADLGVEPGSAAESGAPGAVELDRFRSEGRSLEELIAEARGRIWRDDAPLTVEEQEALRAAAATAAPPVRRALEDLFAASSAEETLEGLDALAASLEFSKTFSDEAAGSSRVSTEQEGEEEADQLAGSARVATPEDESGGGLPPFGQSPATEEEASEEAGTQTAEGTEAGDEGPPVPVDVEPGSLQPPGFVLEKAPTAVGATGEVKSYLTIGVPLEFEEDERQEVSARVSFEQVESIVASREVSPEIAETVRKYFESITEGGT